MLHVQRRRHPSQSPPPARRARQEASYNRCAGPGRTAVQYGQGPVSNPLPTSTTPIQLGERTFGRADQQAFAAASGDVNPMHMDEVAARRLIAGGCVVHGVHLLLQALDWWHATEPARVLDVECTFDHPVEVGEAVAFTQSGDDANVVIKAAVRGIACATLRITTATEGPQAGASPADPAVLGAGQSWRLVEGLQEPLNEAPGSQVNHVFRLLPRPTELARSYARVEQLLGAGVTDALAALSFFVGMVCPGQHSVFSSLRFAVRKDAPLQNGLTLHLKRYDPRFRLFIAGFEGLVTGEIRAFQRPEPQSQPKVSELRRRVAHAEFDGTRSLVVGGSRGLGELTAKLLAAGGGDVVISYSAGREDAQRVAAEINAGTSSVCETVALDLNRDAFPDWVLDRKLTAAFYFATPRIYRKPSGPFNAALFAEFSRFYLERFAALCEWLEARAKEPVRVYLPSSVFIAERPRGMVEYAMAKAAAEVLAVDLNRTLARVKVLYSRLPRLATDQTNAVVALPLGSNVDTLLPVLRTVLRADRPV